jgi:hypothetical protein
VATETDAARDRVLAARGSLGEELEVLEASARAAVDIPAKIKRSPVKAAAVAGGAAFLVLGGPKRVFRAGRRAVTGEPDPLPPSMLPKEIDKALRSLGDDGKKVRGALERDFAAYAQQRQKDRSGLRTLIVLTVARPLLSAAAKSAAARLFSTDDEGFQTRLAQIRERVQRRSDEWDEAMAKTDGEVPGETVMERAAETDAVKDAAKDKGKDKAKDKDKGAKDAGSGA